MKKTDRCICVGTIDSTKYNEMNSRVYSIEALGPAIRTCAGGGTETKIAIYEEGNG